MPEMLSLIALLVATLFAQDPRTGILEGTVLRAGATGTPVADARITLQSTNTGQPLRAETTTDASGRYSFRDLPAGMYQILAIREGYLTRGALRTNLSTPGQRLELPAFNLTPQSTIRGRVIDVEGRPLSGISVEFLQLFVDEQGQRFLQPGSGPPAKTNANGEYRQSLLLAGQYYVRALLIEGSAFLTYFPGTTAANAAAPVVLEEGAERVADIKVDTGAAKVTYKLSGRIVNPLPKADDLYMGLSLVKRHEGAPIENNSATYSINASAGDTGAFELQSVRPGTYDLFAKGFSNGISYLSKTALEVRDRDVDNVSIDLRPTLTVHGRLVVDGDPKSFGFTPPPGTRGSMETSRNRTTIEVRLNRKDRHPTQAFTSVDDETASIMFGAVPEGEYEVSVRVQPDRPTQNPDFYLEDVRVDGQSVFDGGLHVGTALNNPMEIRVGTAAGGIDGTILVTEKTSVSVYLIPDNTRRSNPLLYRQQSFTPLGVEGYSEFKLRGLAPGNYKIFAIPATRERVPYRSVEFLSQYESRAAGVSVQKGTVVTGVRVPVLR